jgi:hypothetical protein
MRFAHIPVPSLFRDRTSNRMLAGIGIGFLTIAFLVPLLLLAYTSLNLEGGGLFENYRTALSGTTSVRSSGRSTTVLSRPLSPSY